MVSVNGVNQVLDQPAQTCIMVVIKMDQYEDPYVHQRLTVSCQRFKKQLSSASLIDRVKHFYVFDTYVVVRVRGNYLCVSVVI